MTVRIGTNTAPRTIIAAAREVKLSRTSKIGEPWQEALWDIYENLGPVHYGMTFKRSAAQRVNYFAAEVTEATDEPVPTENPVVVAAVEELGDLGQIVGDFVIQENVAGEGYLYRTDETDLSDDPYEVLSTIEVKARQNASTIDGLARITDDAYLLRIWRRSPYRSNRPDSPLRSVQDQCEQLLLLNDEISATARSRIPAGLLYIPAELSLPGPAQDPPTEGSELSDPFMEEIIQIATLAISDSDSAARVAPNVMRGPAEYADKIKLIEFGRQMNETFAKMREELLRQIAGGINLPAEILTGLADLNHWSLWGVDESTAKHHVDPDVLHVLSGLTQGYLWPTLEAAGVSDPTNFMIWRDYSDLTARPLSVEQALAMNEAGIVNDEYVRRVANVPEDMAGDGRPAPTQIPDRPEDNPTPDTLTAATPTPLTRLARIDHVLATKITEAAEAAFHRAMERAGVRVRNKARKNQELTALLTHVDNSEVTLHLGPARVEQLQLTADQLIPADSFRPLEARLDALVAEAQEATRTELGNIFEQVVPKRPEEDEDRDAAVAVFIAALLAAATTRLFTDAPDVDPAETGEFGTEIATGQMVFELLTRAGGADVTEFTPESPRGLALGQRTRALLRDHGFTVESETWDWAYWRTPITPFEPHQRLDGFTTIDRHDPRLDGYYPGDHRFCTCNWVPSVLPVES